MYVGFHVKYPLFLSEFNETCSSPDRISKNTQIPNFIKICPEGAELLYANRCTDGQTDRLTDITKLIAAFRNLRTRLQ
jgi:hypothetical protein